jgi:hypothetical protein
LATGSAGFRELMTDQTGTMMRRAMRVLRVILVSRLGVALLGICALIVVPAVRGVLWSTTGHTGTATQGDAITAPKVMVHADRPTLSRKRCVWNAAARSLLICHSPSEVYGLSSGPQAGP